MRNEAEHTKRVVDYYDTTQRFYELLWSGNSFGLHYGLWTADVVNRQQAILKENQTLAHLAKIDEKSVVLDAGCGVMGSGMWLAKEMGATVVGLNVVHKQLVRGKELAEKRGLLEKLPAVEGDFQRLPFTDESFDVFWSLESIEHATDIEALVNEAKRVLRPGGRMIIAATFKGRDELTTEEQRQINVGLEAAGCFNDFRTAEEVSEVLRNVGFSSVQNRDVTDQVMPSAEEIHKMCRWGFPVAKLLAALHITSPILTVNNEWGIYQKGLFKSGATSYNVLLAEKPKI